MLSIAPRQWSSAGTQEGVSQSWIHKDVLVALWRKSGDLELYCRYPLQKEEEAAAAASTITNTTTTTAKENVSKDLNLSHNLCAKGETELRKEATPSLPCNLSAAIVVPEGWVLEEVFPQELHSLTELLLPLHLLLCSRHSHSFHIHTWYLSYIYTSMENQSTCCRSFGEYTASYRLHLQICCIQVLLMLIDLSEMGVNPKTLKP
jgi:hypothetical protein